MQLVVLLLFILPQRTENTSPFFEMLRYRRVITTQELELCPDLQPRVAAMGTTLGDVKGVLVKKNSKLRNNLLNIR
ncbi:MAG: hypothetical protein PV344_01835 [Anaplasma sp.]|nr:hypothetical protein [Anaplasma sp.]